MKKQYIYAGISIFLWSTCATSAKILLNSFNSMQASLLTSFFATVFMFVLCGIKGQLKELKQYSVKDHIELAGIGILGIFLYRWMFYMGTERMEASQAFIINYLWPMMSVIFACIILKEKMTARKIVAILLSFVGVIIVAGNGDLLNMSETILAGAAYCSLGAVCYGIFTALDKKKNCNRFISLMLYNFYSTIVALVCIVVTKDSFTTTLGDILGLIYAGVFTSAIPYVTWLLALQKGDTAKISNLAYITPFLSLVWTSVILKEAFNPYSLLGLAVIMLGVFIQLKDKKNA